MRGLVIVRAEMFGPSGSIVLRLALDTGAMVNIEPLATVGYSVLRTLATASEISYRYEYTVPDCRVT